MNWLHLHVATNHIPVIGLPLLLLILLIGVVRRQAEVIRLVLALLALLAVVSVAVKFGGDNAASQLPPNIKAVQTLVNRHEETGDQATTGVFVFGLLAAFAWFRCRATRPVTYRLIWVVLLVGALTSLLYFRTAWTGGHISHPEFRPLP